MTRKATFECPVARATSIFATANVTRKATPMSTGNQRNFLTVVIGKQPEVYELMLKLLTRRPHTTILLGPWPG